MYELDQLKKLGINSTMLKEIAFIATHNLESDLLKEEHTLRGVVSPFAVPLNHSKIAFRLKKVYRKLKIYNFILYGKNSNFLMFKGKDSNNRVITSTIICSDTEATHAATCFRRSLATAIVELAKQAHQHLTSNEVFSEIEPVVDNVINADSTPQVFDESFVKEEPGMQSSKSFSAADIDSQGFDEDTKNSIKNLLSELESRIQEGLPIDIIEDKVIV